MTVQDYAAAPVRAIGPSIDPKNLPIRPTDDDPNGAIGRSLSHNGGPARLPAYDPE